MYDAYASGSRGVVERILGEDFEILTFAGGKLRRAEVHFGWNL
jgi:hypothetical protein